MENDFKSLYDSLHAEQEALAKKMQAVKAEAVKHVQDLIDLFGIHSNEISFSEQCAKREVRHRVN